MRNCSSRSRPHLAVSRQQSARLVADPLYGSKGNEEEIRATEDVYKKSRKEEERERKSEEKESKRESAATAAATTATRQ